MEYKPVTQIFTVTHVSVIEHGSRFLSRSPFFYNTFDFTFDVFCFVDVDTGTRPTTVDAIRLTLFTYSRSVEMKSA